MPANYTLSVQLFWINSTDHFHGTESFSGFKAQPQGKEGKLKLISTCQYGYCIMEQDVNKVRTGTDSKTQWKPDNSSPIHLSTITGLANTLLFGEL